jgi:hypothetical protein
VQVQLATATCVTTRTVSDFAERLSEHREAAGILIDVSELEDADLTFIQLIDAWRADFALTGRSFALGAHDNEAITSLLSRCGYLEGAEPSDVAFWTGEESE